MYGKLAIAAGFAAGYVLGSKAGRQRYEEIVSQARKVAGNQTVQSTAGVLQAQASDLVSKAKQSDLVSKAKQSDLVSKAKHTVGRGDDRGGVSTSSYPTPGTTSASADLYEPTTGTTTSTDSGSTDLFEPTGSTNPTTPGTNNGSNP